MCWLNPKQCRRTKSVCDKPECRAQWRANESRLQREAGQTLASIIEEMRHEPADSVPVGTSIH